MAKKTGQISAVVHQVTKCFEETQSVEMNGNHQMKQESVWLVYNELYSLHLDPTGEPAPLHSVIVILWAKTGSNAKIVHAQNEDKHIAHLLSKKTQTVAKDNYRVLMYVWL